MLKRIVLSLALTLIFSCCSLSATIDQLTGGQFQLPDGTPCAGCYLYLVLSSDATITGTAQVISGGSPRKFLLDANGSVVAGAQIWGNDQLSPANTYYIATVTYPNGGLMMKPQAWSIVGASPINLTGMTATVPSPLSFPSPVLTGANNNFTGLNTFTQTIQGTITNAQTAATAATASVANTLLLLPFTFATLPASSNGTLVYCSDCAIANPCVGGGTGTVAARFGGVWNCGSAGSSSFSAITAGTNTGAAMVVGAGSSLTASGGGTIAATSAPFAGVGAGTNTNALVVGTGGSLGTSGSGTITATAAPFSGISSATNTTAAMVVGSGSTLGASGTGTITATNSGGQLISLGSVIDAAAPPYNVLPGNSWIDATWTNGSNTVTIGASDAPFTTAMNGWLCGGTSGPVVGTPPDANSVLTKVLGTFTFVSATSGTCSGTAANASSSGTNNGVLVMGPDDTAALNAAWQAASGGASGTGQSQCKSLQLPAGIILTKTGQFNTVNCNNAMTGSLSAGPWVYGWGRTSTRIVPAFDQFNFTGITFNGKNCLFFCHNGINVNSLMIWGAGYMNTGTNNAVMAACSTDTQYNQFEINQWGMGDGGPLIGFWVPNTAGCVPVYSMTIMATGSIGCQFDGPAAIGQLECGPSGKRSVVINNAVRTYQFVAGLPGYTSGSSASTTDACTGAPSVVCIGNGGIWSSNGGDQVTGSNSNVAIDVRNGGTLIVNSLSTNFGSNLGLFVNSGAVVFSCNSFFGGQGTNATGMSIAGGGIYRSTCGNNFFGGTAGGNGIQVTGGTAEVILAPTDGWNVSNGASPTISGTVFGTSPTVGTCSAGFNTAESGCALVTEGTSPPSSGTVILTFNQTYQYTALPVCTLNFRNGSGSWNARVSAITTTQSSTAYTWQVDNNAVALTNGSTYGVIWNCVAR